MKSVNEVCRLSGISRRTLQYYDEIGLLPPSAVKESGYRLYDDESLRQLWSILFYKELGLSLGSIRALLENPGEAGETLRRHRKILIEKQAQLKQMTQSVDNILKSQFDPSMLRDFDKNRLDTVKKTYAAEINTIRKSALILPLIKSGVLASDIPFTEKASRIATMDFDALIALYLKVIREFSQAFGESPDNPDSPTARLAVASFKKLLSMVAPCDDALLRAAGQAYRDHGAVLDKESPGLAGFVSVAVLRSCQQADKPDS